MCIRDRYGIKVIRRKRSVLSDDSTAHHSGSDCAYRPVSYTHLDVYKRQPVYDGSSVVLLVVSFTESVIRIMRFLHQQVEVQEVARLPLSLIHI